MPRDAGVKPQRASRRGACSRLPCAWATCCGAVGGGCFGFARLVRRFEVESLLEGASAGVLRCAGFCLCATRFFFFGAAWTVRAEALWWVAALAPAGTAAAARAAMARERASRPGSNRGRGARVIDEET
ncbi:hypothetical protein PUN4_840119 [Paraburkholderia unamae]|nr:hypothetical protein PUN4_840119 [Paraburkholderia unamae]